MNELIHVQIDLLSLVCGGEGGTRSSTTGGGVTVPGVGGAKGSVTESSSEPEAYLRCLNDRYAQRGFWESNGDIERRQAAACGPLAPTAPIPRPPERY